MSDIIFDKSTTRLLCSTNIYTTGSQLEEEGIKSVHHDPRLIDNQWYLFTCEKDEDVPNAIECLIFQLSHGLYGKDPNRQESL
jgi:hypothetical protein